MQITGVKKPSEVAAHVVPQGFDARTIRNHVARIKARGSTVLQKPGRPVSVTARDENMRAKGSDGHVTAPYVSKGTMTSGVYLRECLMKRLIPFINKYHKNEQILRWQDMAKAHYGKQVLAYLTKREIEFF